MLSRTVIRKDSTSPRCECVGASSFTAWRTACLYGVTYNRTSPTYHDGVTSLVSGKTAPPRGANVWGASSFTAWRTACLYGVTYSRASPRLFDGRTSSVIFTDRTIYEVRIYLYLLSQSDAQCAHPELLTIGSLRLSLITLSFYSLYYIF